MDDVFRRYAPYVARIGFRMLGRADEVDDLVQDVFLAAHRGLRGLRNDGAIRGWLATVTVRAATRRLRARRLRAFLLLDDSPDYADVADGHASPEERAIVADLYRVLDALPAQERVAWVLQRIEGEPLDRVALLCRCSLATAKRRIAAARECIEKAVSDD